MFKDILASRKYLQHLAGPRLGRQVMTQHEVPIPMVQDAQQVPQMTGVGLDRRGRSQEHVVGARRHVAHEGKQFIRCSGLRAEAAPRPGLVRLVQDCHTKVRA